VKVLREVGRWASYRETCFDKPEEGIDTPPCCALSNDITEHTRDGVCVSKVCISKPG
jgi:hypothetical protein